MNNSRFNKANESVITFDSETESKFLEVQYILGILINALRARDAETVALYVSPNAQIQSALKDYQFINPLEYFESIKNVQGKAINSLRFTGVRLEVTPEDFVKATGILSWDTARQGKDFLFHSFIFERQNNKWLVVKTCYDDKKF